jgi:hypothetical protein
VQDAKVYAQPWYLDIVFDKKWECLVFGNYDFVLPISLQKKMFWKFAQLPILTQQLGIFPNKNIPEEVLLAFSDKLQSRYHYIAYSSVQDLKLGKAQERTNCMLSLADYPPTGKRGERLRRAIRSAVKNHIIVQPSTDIETSLTFYFNNFHFTGATLNRSQEKQMRNVLSQLFSCGKLKIYQAYRENELVAINMWLIHKETAYYMVSISNEVGRKHRAMNLLVHTFIEQCENVKTIDFEGSSIEGVKRFFRSFGAEEERYYLNTQNRLPYFLQFIKR